MGSLACKLNRRSAAMSSKSHLEKNILPSDGNGSTIGPECVNDHDMVVS